MADDDRRFREMVLHHMQEVSQWLVAMEVSQRELSRVLQIGEGSGMSRHVQIGRAHV